MNKAEREKQFRKYFDICTDSNKREKEWVGLGNPFAKILIVGQESAEMRIEDNIRDVEKCLSSGNWSNLYEQPRKYESNGKLNRTWNAYQKLIDYIRPEEKRWTNDRYTDFCKDAFTTELNNTVSPHNPSPGTDRNLRIETFQGSGFIKNFPVVILACSHYINECQIIETFDVEPIDECIYSKKTKAMRFKSYRSADHRRLIIHTRQLSQHSKELLIGISNKIKDHFKENGEVYEAVSY